MSPLDDIDPKLCRRWVAERCDVDVVAHAYETAYRTVVARRPATAPTGQALPLRGSPVPRTQFLRRPGRSTTAVQVLAHLITAVY